MGLAVHATEAALPSPADAVANFRPPRQRRTRGWDGAPARQCSIPFSIVNRFWAFPFYGMAKKGGLNRPPGVLRNVLIAVTGLRVRACLQACHNCDDTGSPSGAAVMKRVS